MGIQIGQQLGSLEITALLGKGGMGDVYRARDAKLKQVVLNWFRVLQPGTLSPASVHGWSWIVLAAATAKH